jgi:hypothetical protein
MRLHTHTHTHTHTHNTSRRQIPFHYVWSYRQWSISLPSITHCCESFRYIYVYIIRHFFLWLCGPTRARASSFMRFLDHTQRRITVGRTPLDEWSTRRSDFYLATHNTQNRQTSMSLAGFEPAIQLGERPQTDAIDSAATGTGVISLITSLIQAETRSRIIL